MNSIADDGVQFETAIAQGPFTTFSMPSIFTSRYPSQLTRFQLSRWGTGAMVGDAPTLGERLNAAGYRTMGVHSNPLLSRTFGFHRGFDQFYDSLGSEQQFGSRRFRLLVSKLRRLLRSEAYVPADDLTDLALEWLSETDEEPYFLWVHYMDAHGPYKERDLPPGIQKFKSEYRWQKALQSPDEISDSSHERLRDAYEDEVAFVDEQVGRLVTALEERGDYDGSVLLLSADHGEEFREHGDYSHGNKLYEELLRVPLVVKTGSDTAPDRVQEPVPLLDIAPTLVAAGGGDTAGFEGESLLPVCAGEADPSNERVISEADLEPNYIASVRDDRWKYIHDSAGPELYNLDADPDERDNVISKQQDVGEELSEILSTHTEKEGTEADFSLDSGELKQRLKTLGYL